MASRTAKTAVKVAAVAGAIKVAQYHGKVASHFAKGRSTAASKGKKR